MPVARDIFSSAHVAPSIGTILAGMKVREAWWHALCMHDTDPPVLGRFPLLATVGRAALLAASWVTVGIRSVSGRMSSWSMEQHGSYGAGC
ncbi:MAG: hypothetical protein C4345_07570 [Chloroflexota bacterium]